MGEEDVRVNDGRLAGEGEMTVSENCLVIVGGKRVGGSYGMRMVVITG